MDKIYYDNLCFRFDVKCLFLTVKSVIKSDGVVEGGTGQMSDSEISEKLEEIEKI